MTSDLTAPRRGPFGGSRRERLVLAVRRGAGRAPRPLVGKKHVDVERCTDDTRTLRGVAHYPEASPTLVVKLGVPPGPPVPTA